MPNHYYAKENEVKLSTNVNHPQQLRKKCGIEIMRVKLKLANNNTSIGNNEKKGIH